MPLIRSLILASLALSTIPAAAEPPAKVTRLQGSAYLGRRLPVVGATVVAAAEDGSGRIFLTSTDGKGRIRIEGVPDGSYRVEIRKEGLETVVKREVEVRFPFRPVVEVAMKPSPTSGPGSAESPGDLPPTGDDGVKLSGTVTDGTGEGIPEVSIHLVCRNGSVDPRLLRSGPTGTFSVEGIVPGRWSVEIRGVGYLPVRAGLDIEGDTDLMAYLVSQPARYDATALDLMPPEEPLPPE